MSASLRQVLFLEEITVQVIQVVCILEDRTILLPRVRSLSPGPDLALHHVAGGVQVDDHVGLLQLCHHVLSDLVVVGAGAATDPPLAVGV